MPTHSLTLTQLVWVLSTALVLITPIAVCIDDQHTKLGRLAGLAYWLACSPPAILTGAALLPDADQVRDAGPFNKHLIAAHLQNADASQLAAFAIASLAAATFTFLFTETFLSRRICTLRFTTPRITSHRTR